MQKIFGLDLGSKTCGVASCDGLGMFARSFTTIRFEQDDYDTCFDRLLELLEKEKVSEVVLGLPRHMNGDIGERGKLSQQFADELKKEGIKVHLWDERLTTVAADRLLMASGLNGKKRRKIIDQMAAVQILQSYLDSQKNRG